MILEPGKLTDVRVRYSIAIVISLAAHACIGGPTSDTPSGAPEPGHVDAGIGLPGEDDASSPGASLDAGSAASDLDAAASEPMDAAALDAGRPCDPLTDAGDAGQPDGGAGEASVAADAGDSGADADAAHDAQVDTDANFPDAADDAQLAPADASSDAPHMPSMDDACVP